MSVRFSVSMFETERFLATKSEEEPPKQIFEMLDKFAGDDIEDVDGIDVGQLYYSEEEDYGGSLFDVLHYELEFEKLDEALEQTIELLEKVTSQRGNLMEYEPLIGCLTAQEVVELDEELSGFEGSVELRGAFVAPVQQILQRAREQQMGLLVVEY